VWVIETCNDSYFAEKSFGAYGLGESGMEDFKSYDAFVFGVLGEADGGHPTPTELAVNGIAGSEQLPEALDGEDQVELPRSGAMVRAGLFKLRRVGGAVKLGRNGNALRATINSNR
jgi:hypothetical protein